MLENINNLDFSVNLTSDDEKQAGSLKKQQQAKIDTPTSQGGLQEDKKEQSACAIFTIEYWKEYFDVSEQEIVSKLKSTLNPTQTAFEFLIDSKVDLYGPFWISTTLIFSMIVMPQFWRVLLLSDDSFDIAKIGFAFTLIYGALAAFTFTLYGMSVYAGTKVGLFKIAAVYGYSYTSFLIAAVGTLLWFPAIKLSLILLATVHSILFIVKAFNPFIEKIDQNSKVATFALIVLFQVTMALLLYSKYFA